MKNQSVSVRKEGDVFILSMTSGENRFNPTFLAHFHEALDLVERNEGPAALVTTSEGKFFSNGLDLDWMRENRHFAAENVKLYQKLLARLLSFPMATVAAINGHAFAAGALLTLAHDFRLMREDRGFWCLPEVELDLVMSPGLTALIRAKLCSATLRDALFFGLRFGGKEAQRKAIVDIALPEQQLLPNAIALAQQLASKATHRWALKTLKEETYKDEIKLLQEGLMGPVVHKL
jgi:enoyl-CoA hydratase/carnithine racemase